MVSPVPGTSRWHTTGQAPGCGVAPGARAVRLPPAAAPPPPPPAAPRPPPPPRALGRPTPHPPPPLPASFTRACGRGNGPPTRGAGRARDGETRPPNAEPHATQAGANG